MLLTIGCVAITGSLATQGGPHLHVRPKRNASHVQDSRLLLDCEVGDQSKGDCGFPGVTQDQCTEKGCCYQHTDVKGVPFCFYPASSQDCLPSDDDEDCGWDGIDWVTCRSEGCCYGARAGETEARCFKKRTLTLGTGTEVPEECQMPDANRLDCGFDGITPGQCMDKGCCYFHAAGGHPFCYYKVGKAPPEVVAKAEQCTELDEERVDCGFDGVTDEQCVQRGCCYAHASTPGAPFCYYKHGKAPLGDAASEQCVMADSDRVDCGFEGVTPDECRSKGCCYFHSHEAGSPFCYFRKGQVPPHANESNSPECLVADDKKVNCDAFDRGITHSECQAKGCCYHASSTPGIPSCYFKHILPECQVPGAKRQDCGYKGITPAACRDHGCCYSHSTTIGAAFCFYKTGTAAPSTTVSSAAVTAATTEEASVVSLPPTTAVVDTTPRVVSTTDDPTGSLHFSSSEDKAPAQSQDGSKQAMMVGLAVAAVGLVCLAFLCQRTHPAAGKEVVNGEENMPLKTALPSPKPSVNRLTPGSQTYQDYERHFSQKWDTKSLPIFGGRAVPHPRISGIYELDTENHLSNFKAKQREIDSGTNQEPGGNQKTCFHGARMKCNFQGTVCTDPKCIVCRIVESGSFGISAVSQEIHFRAGSHSAKGQGLAPGKTPPPENLDHFVEMGAGNAVFIADVLLGNQQIVSERTKGPLPPGTHSRVADKDASNGVDEIVIFDEAQALPKALITF